VRLERSFQIALSNVPVGMLPATADETAYGMVVADGMGSMPAAELASSLALHKLVDLVVKTPDWILRMNWRKAAIVKRRMTERFREIDAALRERGEMDPRLTGMGTTMTVAASLGADLFLAHVGDSRAYLLSDKVLRQLTRDHTLSQAMIEAGVGDDQDHNVRGMRRVLTGALGWSVTQFDPDVVRLHLKSGDQLLLCTDGLTEHVDSEAIHSILLAANSSEEACRSLIDAAFSHGGGNDDVTVVLARYRFPQTTH
jgi:protein phosphatase